MINEYNVKMMPGQEPYTKEELDRLYKFVSEAAELDELLGGENGELVSNIMSNKEEKI